MCADFPNQAAAQRAHNTRDPDHDGVYCEDLPLPARENRAAGASLGDQLRPYCNGQRMRYTFR